MWSLFCADAVAKCQQLLFPLAILLTPNLHEAALLAEREITSQVDVECAAQSLLDRGTNALLITGGGVAGLVGKDFFAACDGAGIWQLQPAIAAPHTYGTGCTLSAAITAALVHGVPLADVVIQARVYINQALRPSGCLWT